MSELNRIVVVLTLVCLLTGLGCTSKKSEVDPKSTAPVVNAPSDVSAKSDSEETKPKTEKKPEVSIDESLDVDALMEMKPTSAELDDGWIRLFDGQTLMGWQAATKADWRVEEEAICVSSGEEGLLCTTSRFADYELKLEFQADPKTNSGIFLRTAERPTDPTKDCYELNIAPDDNPFPTGSLVGRIKVEPESTEKEVPNDWSSFHVLVDGDRVQVWRDGKSIVDYRDTTGLASGRIGLQFREGAVKFRNIRIRPILLNQVLPAKDLSQWSFASDSPAKFAVDADGILSVDGGKGHIELNQPYGDFCLQAEVMLKDDLTNSGIFFRCIPGEEMNGYECQLNNAYDKDRRVPKDSGTGAIFRRQAARAVLGDNQRWMHVTIVADGPHVSTWVEGMQVVDWVDTRKPHENPRTGLRVEPGSIILQAHDPECHAKFRKLQVMMLPQ